ncbi:hypothetical protein HWV07_07310 [Natronomonas salina]|uniref:hypothetical protein n=1 Tax=Natronomonas salina TaxID=1710540 RepID=UPI0015B7883E|nr:hypothetical protein [Natronomonas salina]QLD88848.1 hypothetical protein HWV07_07310 [Natronomonas salina]
MIVVATEDFELYHGVVEELRERGVRFTTVEPGDELPDDARVAVVGPEDEHPDLETVRGDPENPRRVVDEAVAILRGDGGRTIVGIDPGDRPGVAVLSGDTVVAAFQVPADEAAGVVAGEIEDAADPLVRIGDGARLQGAKIVEAIEDVPIELVDETGTSPYLGTGARGMGDVLAAVNIARLEGEEIEKRDVEPTAGEIQLIKNRSRERSDDDRTIDEELARRVAVGELSMDEALERHRGGR